MIPVHRSISRLAAGLIISAVAVLYCIWGNSDRVGWVTGDAASYLTMAKAYAQPGVDEIAAKAAAQSRFPPLYPLLLARSGASGDMHRAHQVTLACLLLALGVMFFWLHSEGIEALPAAVYLAAVSSLPDVWLAALSIQSEYLYLLLSLAAVATLARFEREGRVQVLYVAALLIDLAILSRSVGIALLLPLLLTLRSRSWRERLLALALVAGPLIVWHGLHHARSGYMSVGGSVALQRLSPDFLWQQFASVRHGFEQAMLLQPQWLNLLADSLGVVCLLGLSLRCSKLRPDALYLAAYLCIVLLWPYPGDAHRLLWPILPVFLIQPALAFTNPPGRRYWVPLATAATITVLGLPSIAYAAQRYADPQADSIPGARRNPLWYWPQREVGIRFALAEDLLIEALQKMPSNVSERECVLSTRPEWINFFGQRRSEQVPPAEAPQETFASSLKACPIVFMTPFIDRGYGDPMYPLARLGSDLEILDYTYAADPTQPGKSIEFLLARYVAPAGR